MKVVGLSAFFHDSAVALVENGEILSALQEERFSRLKHDHRFPEKALRECLNLGNIDCLDEVDCVVYYEKPFLTFERLLQTHMENAPASLPSFLEGMPVWLQQKLYLKSKLKKVLRSRFSKSKKTPELFFVEHHHAHAGAAFYPSPFEEAAVLCLDGVGEWATTSAWSGKSNHLSPLFEIHFPHSLGLLYSAFTQYLGFKVNNGEYKLMGLSSYGEPIYTELIKENLIHIKSDGSFRLNLEYFDFHTGTQMINGKFAELFKTPPLKNESEYQKIHMDIAASIQAVTEEVVFKLADELHRLTGQKNLCLAGGVALNCVANGKLLRRGPFENIWIQPAAGDAGSAVGSALVITHEKFNIPRIVSPKDSMKGSYLGNENHDVSMTIGKQYPENELLERVTDLMIEGKVIGWHSGKMEFGPRALGSRSILADPRNTEMQKRLNMKIKKRESFRPFAASLLEEDAKDFFEKGHRSPYMLLVEEVKKSRRTMENKENIQSTSQINSIRSDIPAVTHVDFSCRTQTVDGEWNPKYQKLIKKFKEKTGIGLIINTSFNVRGEPIVESQKDALRCFINTDMDVLVLEDTIIMKEDIKGLEIEAPSLGNLDDLFGNKKQKISFWQPVLMSLGLLFFLFFSKAPLGSMYVLPLLPLFMYITPHGRRALQLVSLALVFILDKVFNLLLKVVLFFFYFIVLTPWSLLYKLIKKPTQFHPFKKEADSYMIKREETNSMWSKPF
ncbi:MAG: hypothetical protein EP326_02470 [Deltaproteobacteria bacterium]|nr:MAG: hypothetical protein EP326_02470 [Deltaproteobacteria bacterium]